MDVAVDISKMVEVIPTGLTRNYVGYWDEKQALKEAFQNIAYGVTKSGTLVKQEWYEGVATIEDGHTGFEKKMLYIGESEQRDDEQGLGNFGEGWKVFLLVMARNNRFHRVHTVGFYFFGKMEPTPHGTEVLNIYVVPNSRKVGTQVEVECTHKDFETALASFAVLAGVPVEETEKQARMKSRTKELWINGVRIEQDGNSNPLELEYAYNIKDRTLMNRDRSQVETARTYALIKEIIGRESDKEFILDYVKKAINGHPAQDIQRGPNLSVGVAKYWREVIQEVYGKPTNKLVTPSSDVRINREAEYRGYTVTNFPQMWAFELNWMGIRPAHEVIHIKPDLKEVSLNAGYKRRLQSAKLKVKKCLQLYNLAQLPPIVVVERIEMNGVTHANGLWDPESKTIYLAEEAFIDDRVLTRVLLHECVHWKTGAGDNTEQFTRGFENIIMDLLGI